MGPFSKQLEHDQGTCQNCTLWNPTPAESENLGCGSAGRVEHAKSLRDMGLELLTYNRLRNLMGVLLKSDFRSNLLLLASEESGFAE